MFLTFSDNDEKEEGEEEEEGDHDEIIDDIALAKLNNTRASSFSSSCSEEEGNAVAEAMDVAGIDQNEEISLVDGFQSLFDDNPPVVVENDAVEDCRSQYSYDGKGRHQNHSSRVWILSKFGSVSELRNWD